VSLGEPQANYNPCRIGFNAILLQDAFNFTTYLSSQDLYGSDDVFIAAKFHLKDSTLGLLSQGSATIDALLPTEYYR